uniref:Transposase n=1 Tax=Peronospora matthiolae TaxID=2874970 RepID=A0AAV1T9U4_9STRA
MRTFMDTEREEIWNIVVQCLPPWSPYMNVLDLGVLNAFSCVQYQTESHTTGAPVDDVNRDFDRIQEDSIDKTFSTLQKVMEKVIEIEGDNAFYWLCVKKIRFARVIPHRSRLLLSLFMKVILFGKIG